MAVTETIQEILQGIDDAQYGRDMRQYIHKGIEKCYEEGSAGETDLVARQAIEDMLGNFATVESSSTASRAYAEGDYLVYDSRLYKVTSAIALGGTITPDTNVTATTVTEVCDEAVDKAEEIVTEGETGTLDITSSYDFTCVLRKVGKVATLYLTCDSTDIIFPSSGGIEIGTFPTGFEPVFLDALVRIYIPGGSYSGQRDMVGHLYVGTASSGVRRGLFVSGGSSLYPCTVETIAVTYLIR